MVLGWFVLGQLGVINKTNLYVVTSGSMEPDIGVGSVVLVSEKNFGYVEGDVISFLKNGELVTHRVVDLVDEKGEIGYTTKGDANSNVDFGVVERGDVVGSVWGVIPKLGYVVEWVKKPEGFIVVVVIPATILIWEEMRKMGKEVKKWRKKFLKRGAGVEKILVVLILGLGAFGIGRSGAFFGDREVSGGNQLGAAADFSLGAGAEVVEGNVLINEYLANNSGSDFESEWVELYNAGGVGVDLAGWELRDGNASTSDDIELSGIIGPGEYLVFTNNDWLNNTGDILELVNGEDVVVDSDSFGAIGGGVSRGRETDGVGSFVQCVDTSMGVSNNNICGGSL